jgi:ABC-2 type transport system ATP-binding protein
VPNTGSVQVHGTLVPFIELGVGFNPELTGRENVYLNGALLGFSRKEVTAIYNDIVDFAELSRFMDQKLKNYSSGMQVRLAFSIAIQARQDILLVDEVLAVGDTSFQNKCYKTFRQLKEEGRTIVFVTHDMAAVERFCDRALVLDKGVVKGIYEPREAAVIYEEMNAIGTDRQSKEGKSRRWGTKDVVVKSLAISGKRTNKAVVEQGEPLSLQLSFKNSSGPKPIVLGLAFYDAFGTNMSGPNSLGVSLESSKSVSFTIPQLAFNPGEYTIQVVVFDENVEKEYDHQESAATLSVTARGRRQLHGKMNVFGSWQQ